MKQQSGPLVFLNIIIVSCIRRTCFQIAITINVKEIKKLSFYLVPKQPIKMCPIKIILGFRSLFQFFGKY